MMLNMMHDSYTPDETAAREALANRLSNVIRLLRDLPASSVATFAVLSLVEQGPCPASAICTVLQPVASLCSGSDAAINAPLLHQLIDAGVLEIWHEGPAPGRRGRVYALTASGASVLDDLRRHVRDAALRALTETAADVHVLVDRPYDVSQGGSRWLPGPATVSEMRGQGGAPQH